MTRISTELAQADDLPERAQRSRGLHTGYPGVQEGEPDCSTSSSKARGKCKSKEEDTNKIGNPKNNEDEIAVIDRQINVLNKRKSKLQAKELLNKLEEMRKDIDDPAKAVSENDISLPAGRKEGHGRSGVGSAGEISKTETGKPAPNRGSGSREGRPTVVY